MVIYIILTFNQEFSKIESKILPVKYCIVSIRLNELRVSYLKIVSKRENTRWETVLMGRR